MSVACFLLLANVCLPRDLVPVTDFFATYSIRDANGNPVRVAAEHGAVDRLGVRILVYEGDQFELSPRTGLDVACLEDRCIYYKKHCDHGDRHCLYSVADPIDRADLARDESLAFNKGVGITAKSPAILRQTESRLNLILGKDSGGNDILLPLSRLAKTSGTIDRAQCPSHDERMQGCGEPPFPRGRSSTRP